MSTYPNVYFFIATTRKHDNSAMRHGKSFIDATLLIINFPATKPDILPHSERPQHALDCRALPDLALLLVTAVKAAQSNSFHGGNALVTEFFDL